MTLRLGVFALTLTDETTDVGTEDVEDRDVGMDDGTDNEVGTDNKEIEMDGEEAGTDIEEVAIDDDELEMDDEELEMDDEELEMDNEELETDDEELEMDDEEIEIDDKEAGAGAGAREVGTSDKDEEGAEEVVIDGEDVTTGTVGDGAASGTVLEDPNSAVTELETSGTVERVHFFTSCNSPPDIGLRIMRQVCLTTPVGLEKEGKRLVMSSIPGDPDIRSDKLNISDSGGLDSGTLGSGNLSGKGRG